MKNSFRHAREIIAELRRLEDSLERRIHRKYDWKDPEDILQYTADVTFLRRQEKLNKIVPNRVCPKCDQIRMRGGQWVVLGRKEAICRKCWSKERQKTLHRGTMIEMHVFGEQVNRYVIDGYLLANIRPCSGKDFADACGWTGPYQSKLESGYHRTVSEEKCLKIIEALKAEGIRAGNDIFPAQIDRYPIRDLKEVRETLGMSPGAFAEGCGWSRSYQIKLETWTKTVSKEAALKIMAVIQGEGVLTLDYVDTE